MKKLPSHLLPVKLLVDHLSKDEDEKQELYLLFFTTNQIYPLLKFSKQKQSLITKEVLVPPHIALALNTLYNGVKDLEDDNEKNSL